MKLVKIHIENFGPIQNADYNFEDGVTALVGINKTEPEQGSNGAAKSTISQAIYYALTSNNLRGSVDKKLIRRGTDKAIVCLDLICPIRQEAITIRRELPLKGSSKLSITKNDEVVEIATVKDGNDWILNWLQISAEDLKSYYIVCKEYYKSFFKSSNTEKLALISRFINFSFIDKSKDIIQKKITKLSVEKRDKEDDMRIIQGRLNVYEEQLIKEENRNIEEEKKEKISSYQKKIESAKESYKQYSDKILSNKQLIKEEEEMLNIHKESLSKKEKELSKYSTKDLEQQIDEINKDFEEITKEKNEISKKLSEFAKLKRHYSIQSATLDSLLEGSIECPKCKHKFILGEKRSVKDIERELDEIEQLSLKNSKKEEKEKEKEKELDDITKECKAIQEEIQEKIRSINNQSSLIRREKRSLEDQIDASESRIRKLTFDNKRILEEQSHIEISIKDFEDRIKEIKKEKIEIDTTPIEKNIELCSKEYSKIEKEVGELDREIFNRNEWINRFKEFKMYLASEQIKHIQNKANLILERENSDLRLLIEAFKLDSKGNTKDEITPYILRDDAESFWYYSGGERGRVEIATILAIQEMINSTNPYGGLDFLSIDEVTEGLSEQSLYDVIEAMSFIKFPILITTHILNQNAKCKILKLVKENGISRIEL